MVNLLFPSQSHRKYSNHTSAIPWVDHLACYIFQISFCKWHPDWQESSRHSPHQPPSITFAFPVLNSWGKWPDPRRGPLCQPLASGYPWRRISWRLCYGSWGLGMAMLIRDILPKHDFILNSLLVNFWGYIIWDHPWDNRTTKLICLNFCFLEAWWACIADIKVTVNAACINTSKPVRSICFLQSKVMQWSLLVDSITVITGS